MNHARNKKSPFGGFRGLLTWLLIPLLGGGGASCGDWLDVVPDGVPTLDMAFNSREQALKYLATCYSYMPKDGNPSDDPSILGSDEMWTVYDVSSGFTYNAYYLGTGMQSATSPILERWTGLYRALRDCNTFLENVDVVPDLSAWEREQWIAEVKVLKAYYHFLLVQMYGPVPIVRENSPIDVDFATLKVERNPVDDCFRYIVELLDEACDGDMLPPYAYDPQDLGRITKPIALSLKAKALVTAASPLFNCNEQQATLKNRDDMQLFSQDKEKELEKWEQAMVACKAAIDECREAGLELYVYPNIGSRYSDIIVTDLTLRNAFNLKWNSEIIWANTQSVASASMGSAIGASAPQLNPEFQSSINRRSLGVPLKIATMFYTRNGVPLDEDNTRNMDEIYNFRVARAADNLYIREGRTTIDLHFDREPRFYSWIGFDGAVWFGAGQYNDNDPSSLYYLGFKMGEVDGNAGKGPYTGYIPKKYIPYEAQLRSNTQYSAISYPWPIMRLSDLYLLYAEAVNEAEGPDGANSDDMFYYIDEVRKRAGLLPVKTSWNTYTNNPKYVNKSGMRDIIRQERMIELSFEGHRFWDMRRWKTAPEAYRTPVMGWYMNVAITDGTESEVNEIMYTPQILHQRDFRLRDYFWPISNDNLVNNKNLVQNIDW